MSLNLDKALTRVSLLITILAFSLGLADILGTAYAGTHGAVGRMFETCLFTFVIATLVYGGSVYHVTRLAQLRRHASHAPATRGELESVYDESAPASVTILVPSYKEEHRVILQTLLSAALAEYPRRRAVLLIDDPPRASPEERSTLEETRRLVKNLNAGFATKARWFSVARQRFHERARVPGFFPDSELQRLSGLYEEAADFVQHLGAAFEQMSAPAFAHVDRFFLNRVIQAPAEAHRARAAELRRMRSADGACVAREYRRLAALFAIEITSFERKSFDNLSHEPNKAMNLNSYIGLMGRIFAVETGTAGMQVLRECEPGQPATLRIPETDYVLTLDADSVILPDYILTLTRVMSANRRLAVVQTPYSAFPDAPSTLERVAGATTDIQYLVHQGFTGFNATFWVGANALLRLAALRDIRTFAEERGQRVPVFIQSQTVIEDTGSTIDLAHRNWLLFNYPERLAYSATPPDFGALVIQRRRWANGGLIIFPSLVRLALRRNGRRPGIGEFWVRAHYLLSPAYANVSLLILLLFPFDSAFSSFWFPVAAVPYYFLYGLDLRRSGYRLSDLARVYALTLLLLPVNLAGVLRSIHQIATGRKSSFGRTPKVEGRTGVPAVHLGVLWSVTAVSLLSIGPNAAAERYFYAAFSAVNAVFFLYGLLTLIGWEEGIQDLRLGLSGKRLASFRTAGSLRAKAQLDQPVEDDARELPLRRSA